jgi:hypothetical protein
MLLEERLKRLDLAAKASDAVEKGTSVETFVERPRFNKEILQIVCARICVGD